LGLYSQYKSIVHAYLRGEARSELIFGTALDVESLKQVASLSYASFSAVAFLSALAFCHCRPLAAFVCQVETAGLRRNSPLDEADRSFFEISAT
jgi:hypothetical protein